MRNKKYIIAISGILLILVLVALIYFKNKDSNYTNNKKMFNELLLISEKYKIEGDYAQAEKTLEESLKYSKTGYYYLGMLYNDMNEEKKARKSYEQAYEHKVFEAATLIGEMEEKSGNFKEAEKWYKRGVKNNKGLSAYALAMFYYNRNDKEKSKIYLRQATNKKEGQAIYFLAKVYYKEKNWEELKKCQKQILEEKEIYRVKDYMKKDIEYMLGTEKEKQYFDLTEEANKFIEKKDYEKAEKIFLEAAKLNNEGYYEIAKMYSDISNEKAVEKYKIAYEKGVARAAGDIGSYYYDEKKDVETAKKWIQMAIDGGDVDSNFYLGEIYENAGDLRQALKYYSIPANNKKAIAMSIARSLASELGDKKLADYWYNKIFSEPGIEQLSEQLVIGLGK